MPDGAVCLTFDFDAISLWLDRDMRSPAALSRGEFGAVAVPRILDLLAARDITSTWFIPGSTIETFPDLCREVVAAGHEVGLHGYVHERVGRLDKESEREIFRRAYDAVGTLTGRIPTGNRTPSWDFSPYTLEIMLELGLQYDSSLMSNDYTPFYCRRDDTISSSGKMNFGAATSLVELPVSWSLDDYPHFEYYVVPSISLPGLRSATDVFANFHEDIVYMQRDFNNGVAVVTFHPQVVGRGHRLLGLERWIDEITEMGTRFAVCSNVAAAFRAGAPLGIYSPERGRVGGGR